MDGTIISDVVCESNGMEKNHAVIIPDDKLAEKTMQLAKEHGYAIKILNLRASNVKEDDVTVFNPMCADRRHKKTNTCLENGNKWQ